MVVFKCRKLNEAMSNCYDKHYNEEAFQTYAKDRGFVTAKMLEK
jgi:Cytochrome c oxidase biogenesis protein Cmc1 like